MSNTCPPDSQDSKADVTTSTRGNGASLRRATVANWLPSSRQTRRYALCARACEAWPVPHPTSNTIASGPRRRKQAGRRKFVLDNQGGLVVKFSVPIESSFQLFSVCTCHEIVPPKPVPDAYRRIKERSPQISPRRARESAIQLVSGCSYSRFLGPEAQIRLEKLK